MRGAQRGGWPYARYIFVAITMMRFIYLKTVTAVCVMGMAAFPAIAAFNSAVFAGDDYPVIAADVNPGKTAVGEPVKYRVIISGEGALRMRVTLPQRDAQYPLPGADAKNEKTADGVPLCIVHDAEQKDASRLGKVSRTLTVSLSYYRPGRYALPDIDIDGPDGVKIGYRVPVIDVRAVNPQGEFQDIEPPLDLYGNYLRVLVLCACLFAVAAALFFGWRYWKKRKVVDAPVPEPPRPIDVFMRDLEALKKKRFIENEKSGEFAVELSRIFRKYVSALFEINAMEMTDAEMINAVRRGVPAFAAGPLCGDMAALARLWSLSKFAEFPPPEGELRANLEAAAGVAKRLSREARRARD